MSDEPAYRRLEDREWQKSVDSRLVSLTSAQKTTDDELDKIESRLDDLDQLLEGDPLKREDSGLKGDVKEINAGVNELRAIMAPDHLGEGGIKNRLTTVERELGIQRKGSDNRWKFAGVVVGATVGAIATIIVALLAIEPVRNAVGKYLESHFSTPSSSRNLKNGSKRNGSKARRKPARPARQAIREDPDETPDEGVSEMHPTDGLRPE